MGAIGEMWGERAVQAPFCLVACSKGERKTMIGGVVLDGFGIDHKTWERWRGTIILIPKIIETARYPEDGRIDQMVVGPLGYDIDATDFKERAKKKHNSYWRPTFWEPTP